MASQIALSNSNQSVWKTIKLGTGLHTSDCFRKAFKKANCHISISANDILSRPAFTTAPWKNDIKLVVISVAELGFKHGVGYADICKRGVEVGLEICPAEVGPQLRLQYPDQPKSEYLFIA